MKVSVSVITICRNAEDTIEQAIQGVISQTYPHIEYIVIDGASSDRTLDIIHRYRDHIAHIVSEPDEGVYQAMNKGISLATGEWIYFANADDYLYGSDVIQDVVNFIMQHPDCDFIYGNHETRFPWGVRSTYAPARPDQALEQLIFLGNCFIQPASFFKADLFKTIGLFNESYRIAADYEWFCKMLSHSNVNVCYFPRLIVSYYQGGLSSNLRPLFEEVFAIQNSLPIYQKPEWIERRMLSLQEAFVTKYEQLDRSNRLSLERLAYIEKITPRLHELSVQASSLATRIAAMESSKFWKLRNRWFQLKRKLGLPTEE